MSRSLGLEAVVEMADTVPGWVKPPASREVALYSYALAEDPVIVEVGCFLGRSTILLAAGRKKRGSGMVHVIDPFDGSGEDFSVPYYQRELEASKARNLEEAFRANVARAGVDAFVTIHKGTSLALVEGWTKPIDLLLLDGDQSPEGQRASYERWVPHLKAGGILMMHNVGERDYAPGHDGGRLLELHEIKRPTFRRKEVVQHSLFATKA